MRRGFEGRLRCHWHTSKTIFVVDIIHPSAIIRFVGMWMRRRGRMRKNKNSLCPKWAPDTTMILRAAIWFRDNKFYLRRRWKLFVLFLQLAATVSVCFSLTEYASIGTFLVTINSFFMTVSFEWLIISLQVGNFFWNIEKKSDIRIDTLSCTTSCGGVIDLNSMKIAKIIQNQLQCLPHVY